MTWLSGRRRWFALALPLGGAVVAGAILASSVLIIGCGTGAAAIGCGAPVLEPRAGFSVVTGKGHLAGAVRHSFGTSLHEFVIDDVTVLAGPARAATVRGWLATVPSPGPGLAPAQVPGMWAPDGSVLAYVQADPHTVSEASTLGVRPIVRGAVVFSAAACGSAPAGLRTVKFEGPLSEVPDSRSYKAAQCNGGFQASFLKEFRDLLG